MTTEPPSIVPDDDELRRLRERFAARGLVHHARWIELELDGYDPAATVRSLPQLLHGAPSELIEAVARARIRRAARGTRFDWYVGVPGTDLEDAVALEVGGTDRQRANDVLAKKLRQLRQRAAGRPGLAVAVQMRTPRAIIEEA